MERRRNYQLHAGLRTTRQALQRDLVRLRLRLWLANRPGSGANDVHALVVLCIAAEVVSLGADQFACCFPHEQDVFSINYCGLQQSRVNDIYNPSTNVASTKCARSL